MSVIRSRSEVAAQIELPKECLETGRRQTEETLRTAISEDTASGAAPCDSDGSQRRRKYYSLLRAAHRMPKARFGALGRWWRENALSTR